MTDILERLRGYNPPDRTIDEQRGLATDLHDAASEIEKLRAALWPFAMHYQIKAGFCADDFRRAHEATGELPIKI